jgi:hypothetical protein
MNMPLVIQSDPWRRRAQSSSQRARNENHPRGERPCSSSAEMGDDLAPFTPIEMHPLPLAEYSLASGKHQIRSLAAVQPSGAGGKSMQGGSTEGVIRRLLHLWRITLR